MKHIEAHENPVCTLVCARNMLFSGSLKTIKVNVVLFISVPLCLPIRIRNSFVFCFKGALCYDQEFQWSSICAMLDEKQRAATV